MSNKIIDADQPRLRLRKIYLRDLYSNIYDELNEEEIKEIVKRREIIEWL